MRILPFPLLFLFFLLAVAPSPFLGTEGSRWTPSNPTLSQGSWRAELSLGRDDGDKAVLWEGSVAFPLEGNAAWSIGGGFLQGKDSPDKGGVGMPIQFGYRSRFEAPNGDVGGMDWGVVFGLPLRRQDKMSWGLFTRVGGSWDGALFTGPLNWGAGLAYEGTQDGELDHLWRAGLDLWKPSDYPAGVRVEHLATFQTS
ncbi:hypothetical protein H8D30_04185 [bacterium]|nr:hypothetical protein [bacterium]